MSIQRNLAKIYTPQAQQGFLGAGHLASPLIQVDFSESDPFIALMDDRLEKRDEQPVGGPHPHAGFETVSLLLEGEMGDKAYRLGGGDLQLMTAGSGVIHTETIERQTTMRLLQLWLTLPKKDRWATPRVQDIPLDRVPNVTLDGSVDIKVYSGSLAGVTSPVQNYTPLILTDIRLAPHASTVQYIPALYTAFLYGIDGSVEVGNAKKRLTQDQVGWLDRFADDGLSELSLTAGETGGRVILYAGERQGDEIVSHGPFIGNTQEDIRRLYQDFRQGRLHHIDTLPKEQRIMY